MEGITMRKSSGIGATGLLGIAFIVLKLVGVIGWSWVWVLSPFWIGAIVWVLAVVVFAFIEDIYG